MVSPNIRHRCLSERTLTDPLAGRHPQVSAWEASSSGALAALTRTGGGLEWPGMIGDVLAEWSANGPRHMLARRLRKCDRSNSVVKPSAWTYVRRVGHRERLRREIAQFMKAYGRVADRNGPDPNDRD